MAQPYTEVYLFDYSSDKGLITLSNPKNISNNPGKYDNQPSFSQDESTLYFNSAIDKNPDIMSYDIESGLYKRISKSPGGEYSPQVTPDGKYISAIILEDNGQQLFWKYPIEGGRPTVVVPDRVIGYYTWWDNVTLVSFVLGDESTLQITNTIPMKHSIVADNIGRSIHNIPNTGLVSFTKSGEIRSLNPKTRDIQTITKTLDGSQDMAWLSDGSILMGKESELYQWTQESGWQLVIDLNKEYNLGMISRIATAKDKIAIVINE
ncbi:MAG: hypothetical protein AAGC88_07200 [Bacteroidota bacterium]